MMLDAMGTCQSLEIASRYVSEGERIAVEFRTRCAHGFDQTLTLTVQDVVRDPLPLGGHAARVLVELCRAAEEWHGPSLAEMTDWGWFYVEASA